MNKKIATGVGAIILIIIAATIFYFVKKANDLGNTKQSQPGAQTNVDNKKEVVIDNNVLPPLATVEGTVENVTPEGVLTLKDKLGQRNIVLPPSVYVYAMVKNVPQTKGIADIKKGSAVVVQLKADTQPQEASSVFIK